MVSLTHAKVEVKDGKYFEHPKEFDHPFATVEYVSDPSLVKRSKINLCQGRTCVMTLGFTARESRPILAYVGTQIPGLLETSLTVRTEQIEGRKVKRETANDLLSEEENSCLWALK